VKTYLVGGAVRDDLLNLPVKEKDWVVVGGTPEAMIAQGFKAVGKDFPVFLHPDTGEEYALARLERKVAPGYRGFVTEFSSTVTLEEDLKRRDLTINAMAQDDDGQIIDPYGGQVDLVQRQLRHVSDAFVEDPVRILRVARFLARFAPLGFEVARETQALMRQMIANGEAKALVPERVWRELERLLCADAPSDGLLVLQDCNAWSVLLPELPEGQFPPAIFTALKNAAQQGASGPARFSILLQPLTDKGISDCCARWRVPNEYRELVELLKRMQSQLHTAAVALADTQHSPPVTQAVATQALAILEAADAFRRPERFLSLLEAYHALEENTKGAATLCRHLAQALTSTRAIKLTPQDTKHLQGAALGQALHQKRLQALQAPPSDP
jgi:tRNA nucleotidyltransferase (CCA-adding enzyme)